MNPNYERLDRGDDFANMYFWRLPLAALILSFYAFFFLSPFYRWMYYGLAAIVIFNTFNMTMQLLRVIHATCCVVRVALEERRGLLPTGMPRHHHVLVIPNYAEDIEVLRATVDALAKHPAAATHYTLVLAMEAKEAGHEKKAAILEADYADFFYRVIHTVHTLLPGEMPGKASNVNAAVRQVSKMHWALESDMVTILDADAMVHARYIDEVDRRANQNDLFAAPVLFEQNFWETPLPVAVNDYMWAAMSMQSAFAWTGIGFPMSTYSLSMALARRIGFWDTHPDAIGEDMHTMIKAMVKTGCESKIVPIPVPMNLAHVSSASYVGKLWARVMQAERHMRGIADTAYVLKHYAATMRQGRWSLRVVWRAFMLLLSVLEAHLLPFYALNVMLWTVGYFKALQVRGLVAAVPPEVQLIDYVSRACIVLGVCIILCYEVMRHVTCNFMYKRAATFRAYWIPGYLLLLMIALPYSIGPTLYVTIRQVLNLNSNVYWVAPKTAQAQYLAA